MGVVWITDPGRLANGPDPGRSGHSARAPEDGQPGRPMTSAHLRVPAPAMEVAEHDRVAAVGKHELEVTPGERAAGPPAVLDHPLLGDRLDGGAADGRRHAHGARLDAHWTRGAEPAHAAHRGSSSTGYGASTARRSGRRESGSTSSTRSAASGPTAWRSCPTASAIRARLTAAGERSSTSLPWS